MWLIPNDQIAVAEITRAGSTSMRECLHIRKGEPSAAVLNIPTRLMFVRDPMQRLISGFWYFHHKFTRPMKKNHPGQALIYENCRTWPGWIDTVLTQQDSHWLPQIEFVTHEGAFLPTDVYPFERINDVWPVYFKSNIPWLRATVMDSVDTDYRLQEIETKYAADYRLRAEC